MGGKLSTKEHTEEQADIHNSRQDQNPRDGEREESSEDNSDEDQSSSSSPPRDLGNARTDDAVLRGNTQSGQETRGWYKGPDGHEMTWSSDGDSCVEISRSTPQDQKELYSCHPRERAGESGFRGPTYKQARRKNYHACKQEDGVTLTAYRRGHTEGYDFRTLEHQKNGLKQEQGSRTAGTRAPFGDESSDKEDSFCTASDVSSSRLHSDESEDEATVTNYYLKSGRQAGRGDRGGQRSNIKGAGRGIWLEGASSKENLPCKHDTAEGLFLVKHEMENYATKAVDRSWQFVYITHESNKVWFYENKDFATLGLTLDGSDPLDLSGAIVCPLRDYSKRSHVFCIQLTSGARYLFQAQDEMDMLYWICRLSSGTGDTSQDCFTQGKAPTRGSPSKTDRLKNFVRGGLSAIWK